MTQTSSQPDELLKSCRDSIAILKKYVPWFEANKGIDHGQTYEELIDKNGRKCGIYYIGDNLDKTFSDFLGAIEDSPFYDFHYTITTNRLLSQYPHVRNAIPAANLQESCALLTHLIRGEHFCDGFHQEAVEDGSFLRVINRIIELVENGDVPFVPSEPDSALETESVCSSVSIDYREGEKSKFTLISRTYIAGSKYTGIEPEEYDKRFFSGFLNLISEPENPYDSNAVRIEDMNKVKLGYLPRTINEIPSRLLTNGYTLYAEAEDKICDKNGCVYYISVLMDSADDDLIV